MPPTRTLVLFFGIGKDHIIGNGLHASMSLPSLPWSPCETCQNTEETFRFLQTSSDLQDHAQELLALLESEPGGRRLSLRDPHRPRLISEIQWEYRTRNANMTWVIWDWWEEWRLYITKNTGVPMNSNSWAGRWDWEGAKELWVSPYSPSTMGSRGAIKNFRSTW